MKYTIVILFITILFTSCSKWLDVQPESEVGKDELFSTEAGFQESLNGVYSRCSEGDLYGNELLVGLTEVMSQNYTISVFDYNKYAETSQFNFSDPDFRGRRNRIWQAAYHAITNCNLILENIEAKKTIFSGNTYELIKGEALALRAYLHFDMLRLFAPSYGNNSAAKAIPYVVTYSNKVTPLSTVKEVIDLIVVDLEAAKALLVNTDPIVAQSYSVGYPQDVESTETTENTLFLQNRRHRMNYYAVCGSLARVALYAGNPTLALSNAQTVIESEKFPWTKESDFVEAQLEKRDRILYKELVMAWYIPGMEDVLENRFNAGTTSLYMDQVAGRSIYEVASVGAEDLRFKIWFSQVTSNESTRLEVQKYRREKEQNLHYLMAPAIRLSELYYIAAESIFDTNPVKAWDYFNTVRFHRGIGTAITNEPSKEFFLNELLKEYRKEFYAEGQVFYAFKRLNKDIIGQNNNRYPASDGIFVLPLPEDEIEFSNR